MQQQVRNFGNRVAILVLGGQLAYACEALASNESKPLFENWTSEATVTLLESVNHGEVIHELANPNNTVYQLPATILTSELRPEVKLTYGQSYQLKLRPRFSLEQSYRQEASPAFAAVEKSSKTFMNVGYLAVTHSSSLQTTIGLQNYQWGPAELASPSNPLFRDLGLDKSFFFETRGQALVRINYSPNPQLSVVAIGEPLDNGASRPLWNPDFHQQVLLKLEYSDQTQTNYLGILTAAAEEDQAQFGAYGHYELRSGLTAYFDLIARHGSRVWYPVIDPQGARFVQNRRGENSLETTAVVGMRYATDGGWDYRLEGIEDRNGWTLNDQQNARYVLALAPFRENVQLYLSPGAILPGKRFIYSSLRIPDWGPGKRLTLALRILHSVADATERQLLTLDSFLGDHFVLSGGAAHSSGKENGELTQAYRWSGYLAGALSW